AQMGTAGGFAGKELRNEFFPHGGTPDGMRRTGFGARDAWNIWGRYGMVPSSGRMGGVFVRSFARAINRVSWLGSVMNFLSGRAGFGANIGAVNALMTGGTTSESGLDRYFRRLESITSIAVAQGLDRSQVIGSLEHNMRAVASAGGFVGSGSGIADLTSRL